MYRLKRFKAVVKLKQRENLKLYVLKTIVS